MRAIASILSHCRPFSSLAARRNIKNIAVVAHVDHGKTSFVDKLIQYSGMDVNVTNRLLDSHEIEKERGITILSKSTRLALPADLINIAGEPVTINLLDTPGHSDFGAEVERVLEMVDGVILLVDGTQGPQIQTRFVLKKALINPDVVLLVVINKVDRMQDSSVDVIDNSIFELFDEIGAKDSQMDYQTWYGSAVKGIFSQNFETARQLCKQENTEGQGVIDLLRSIVSVVPEPCILNRPNFLFYASQLDFIPLLGTTVTGKIWAGSVKQGDKIFLKSESNENLSTSRVKSISVMKGIERSFVTETVEAGDIVSLTLEGGDIRPSVSCVGKETDLPIIGRKIDPPVISVKLSVNDSPLAGKDGKFTTPASLGERLKKEEMSNVCLVIEPSKSKDSFLLKARGELHLGVIFETMRREGYEFSIEAADVVCKTIDGVVMEPWEKVSIISPVAFSQTVTDRMLTRKAEMLSFDQNDADLINSVYEISSKNLMGFSSAIRTLSGGAVAISSEVIDYRPKVKDNTLHRNGVMVASDGGRSHAVDLRRCSKHGTLFITNGVEVYPGMIIGETNGADIDLVCCKSWSDQHAKGNVFGPVQPKTLEEMLEYIQDDEKIEVTPRRICMRKTILDASVRKRIRKQK